MVIWPRHHLALADAALIPTSVRPVLRLVLAGLILHIVLVQPNHPAAMTWGALFVAPLELPVVLLGLMAIGTGRFGIIVRGVLTFALTLIVTLKTADFVMFTALNRGFNPVSDLPLVGSMLQLLAGALGFVPAVLAAIGAALAIVLCAAMIWWATGVWAQVGLRGVPMRLAAIGAMVFAGIATIEVGHAMGRWSLPVHPPGAAFTARVGVERIAMAQATLANLRAFRSAAATDPYLEMNGLLDLIDRDVLIVFVESYGRTSHDTPFYAERHRETLAAAEARLGSLGMSMTSGFLASPTRGGQSWLAHATFANGLWIDGQTSYGAALASGRETLFHIARRSGFRTAAVMPQITLEWPESQLMGFDTVLAARDLDYRGKPFNWVTMPDQFTFSALDRLLRDGEGHDRPLFAQIALGSSHAPWVPVPDLVEWEAIGDGRIFNAMAVSGDPPEMVWRDRARVRAQYRMAIDYALRTVFAYAERHAGDPPLLIVVGDHQAAGFVALDERPDVPVHVIGPAALVERMSRLGFHPGLLPPSDATVLPMDRMRHLVLQAFSSDLVQEAMR